MARPGALNTLKRLMETLPLGYLQYLTHIYVVDGGSREKSAYWFTFNSVTLFVKNKTYYAESFEEVCVRLGAKPLVMLEAVPKYIAERITLAKEPLPRPPQPLQMGGQPANVPEVIKPKFHPLEHYVVLKQVRKWVRQGRLLSWNCCSFTSRSTRNVCCRRDSSARVSTSRRRPGCSSKSSNATTTSCQPSPTPTS